MRKLTLIVHISLDGFVAGPNGDLSDFPSGEENLAFVCRLTETADTVLLGRITYDMLNSYWPTAKDLPNATEGMIAYSNWYNKAQIVVISKTISGLGLQHIKVISNNLVEEITDLKKQSGRNILIFGSPSVAQKLMESALIDHFWIFINPIIFGKGIGLFTALKIKSKLKTTLGKGIFKWRNRH